MTNHDKSNGITAAPQLLAMLSLRGKLKRAGWDNGFLINILSQFAKIHMR